MKQMMLTAELVARCERPVPDPGRLADRIYLSDEDYLAAAQKYAAEKDDGPFWVFAYGSLIWNPGFNYVEHLRGTTHGWHRQFSMQLTSWRGTPEQPGLMLALEHGGSCDGILFRLPEEKVVDELLTLLLREVDRPGDLNYIRWVTVRTNGVKRRALVFWAHPKGFHMPEPPTKELAAQMLARACGHMGSCASYLYNTVAKLSEYGIYDRNLWHLQELVAREILAMPPATHPPTAARDKRAR